MKRRQFITACMGLATTTVAGNSIWLTRKPSLITELNALAAFPEPFPSPYLSFLDPPIDREQAIALQDLAIEDVLKIGRRREGVEEMDHRDADTMGIDGKQTSKTAAEDMATPKQIQKSIDFARDYDDDIFVSKAEKPLLASVYTRLQMVQKTIGYGHFNLVSFDETLRYAKRYSAIGVFSKEELAFIEKLFATDAKHYGFYGDKVSETLTTAYKKSDVIKIPGSGHYILKHEALSHYEKLTRDVGDSVILTSGIRSNVKQLYLFLAKTITVKGNLSRASRSLAPPGYSYHGIGDFDVGRVGWGAKNFTDDFASTDEFKKMQELGYIAIRYDHGNNLGVRFEPWHIKVV